MIIPEHWAEARRQHRAGTAEGGRQVTVRRFGWSDTSAADAQAMADARAEAALARILAGEALPRREPKVPYNGAAGVPIREQVVDRLGPEVVTRNAYGARCLNTPRALFADVDFDTMGALGPGIGVGRLVGLVFGVLLAVAIGVGWLSGRWGVGLGLALGALLGAFPLAQALARLLSRVQGGPEAIARRRLAAFCARHTAWAVRLYRTPSGLRLLATHAPMDANAPEVEQFFEALGVDPVYRRMCRNQQCFRARLTAKPWRIGIVDRLRPRPGVWPVEPERRAERDAWIARYEQAASRFAACRFVEAVGSGAMHIDLRAVVEVHDRESRALLSGLTLA